MYKLLVLVFVVCVQADYWSERQKLVEDEESMAMGGKIKLSDKEIQANEILMKFKRAEMEFGFKNPGSFPPAMHFFRAKKEIEKSMVFSILRQMPKGAVLHSHDTALMSADWMLNVTYRDHLLACKRDNSWSFAFADPPPSDCWKSVKQMREQATSTASFDNWLKSLFTLEVENPEVVYKDINYVWSVFMSIFGHVTPIITYRPVFEEYLYAVLQKIYEDNIMYMEMRGTLPLVYDVGSGWPSNPIQVVGIMQSIVDRFVEEHPDFLGMKFIYGPPRNVEPSTVDEYLQIFQMMQEMYPDFVAGFDLVGQEDKGRPLKVFVDQLLEYKDDTKYFFHAGETDWYGMSTDMNLIDAVLLNTTRIGHGYALTKHPKVMEVVKNRGIAVEVNPISNQVLMLVKDIRNHPASILLAQDFPVVISSDDPGFWGAAGLSYDFYMAFMGMANEDADLKMLKQLAMNSIQYSAMAQTEKNKAMVLWEKKWNTFLDSLIKTYRREPNVVKNNAP